MFPEMDLTPLIGPFPQTELRRECRLAPVLKTIFHQCVMPYTCSQSISDGSVTEPSELDWLQVYYRKH